MPARGTLPASAELNHVLTAGCCWLLLQVGTLASGEIDYDDLRTHLAANKDKPAILNVNIGTTVKGAVDDLDKVCGTGEPDVISVAMKHH